MIKAGLLFLFFIGWWLSVAILIATLSIWFVANWVLPLFDIPTHATLWQSTGAAVLLIGWNMVKNVGKQS